jgi:hypothetical protein
MQSASENHSEIHSEIHTEIHSQNHPEAKQLPTKNHYAIVNGVLYQGTKPALTEDGLPMCGIEIKHEDEHVVEYLLPRSREVHKDGKIIAFTEVTPCPYELKGPTSTCPLRHQSSGIAKIHRNLHYHFRDVRNPLFCRYKADDCWEKGCTDHESCFKHQM